jgi:hypothetical protein
LKWQHGIGSIQQLGKDVLPSLDTTLLNLLIIMIALKDQLIACGTTWLAVPHEFWRIWIPLSLMTWSVYPWLSRIPLIRRHVRSPLDLWFFASLFAFAFYKVAFTTLNAALRLPLTGPLFYLSVLVIGGWGWYRNVRSPMSRGRSWSSSDSVTLALLLLFLMLIAYPRFANTLRYPNQLLDSDPYRHYPRTEWIAQTGHIASSEPWLTGQVPIYEAQGCYVMAAMWSRATGVDSWTVWKYGSPLMGAWSAVALYLFFACLIGGRQGRFAGLMAAGIVGSLTIHIWRTNVGFSEAWAMPLIPPSWLMLFMAFRHRSIAAGTLFGLFFTAISLSNMIPAVYMLIVIVPFAAWLALRMLTWNLIRAYRRGGRQLRKWRRDALHLFSGLLFGILIFTGFVVVWSHTYAILPLYRGANAHDSVTEARLAETFDEHREGKRKNYQAQFGSVAAGVRAEAERLLRDHGTFAFIAARLLGSFRPGIGIDYAAHNMQRFISWPMLKWGLIALLMISIWPVEKSGSRNPFRWAGGRPRSLWQDIRLFVLWGSAITLAQFVFLERLLDFGMPVFQSKAYRYLVYPGYFLAMAIGLATSLIIEWSLAALTKLFRRLTRPTFAAGLPMLLAAGLMAGALFIPMQRLLGRPSRVWAPTVTGAEEAALYWMLDHLPLNSVVFCNWFHADYVRTYSARAGRPIYSVFTSIRPDVKAGQLSVAPPLHIPEVETIDAVIGYAQGQPDVNFYIFSGYFGPFWNMAADDRLVEAGRFAVGGSTAELWALASNPQPIPPHPNASPISIGKSELGAIRGLHRIHDGSIGTNHPDQSAFTHVAGSRNGLPRSHWAWFGLRWQEPREINAVRAYLGFLRDPLTFPGLPRGQHVSLMYVASEYVFQYRQHGIWHDLPGTHVLMNTNTYVVHTDFEPVKTDAIRIYLHQLRNSLGEQRGGQFRAAILEFDYREVDKDWAQGELL